MEADAGPVLDLSRYVPGLLTFLANKLSRSASVLYQREFGVNVTEWRIMAQLAIEPGIPASRICQVIGFDKGPVSRSLATMERKGILTIAVDPADARRRVIALSAEGRSLHDRIIAVALERERRLLACLSIEERERLIASLSAMHENLPAVSRPIAVRTK
jgi:DNA-binding MarR family transcriptional regulator